MRKTIEFATEDGTVLRGWVHTDGDRSAASGPGIVMAHGFGGVKEQIAHYADLFAQSGFSVLLYDHRGFGESDGLPRQEVDPYRQIADWRDAITVLDRLPEVDSDKGIGVWGSSFAGGLALVVAACDPRVSVVAVQIPHVSGPRNAPLLFSPGELAETRARSVADRTARLGGAAPETVPVFTTDPGQLCALPPAVSPKFIAIGERSPNWRNQVTVRSVAHTQEFEPAGWVPFVSPKPMLMVLGELDVCTFTDVQREVFATAGEPKRLVTHPGGHFETYDQYFDISGPAARDWFVEHLTDARRYPLDEVTPSSQ